MRNKSEGKSSEIQFHDIKKEKVEVKKRIKGKKRSGGLFFNH